VKVAFKQVRGNSGTDVWTDSLAAALRKQGVEGTTMYYPTYYGLFPQLAGLKWDTTPVFDILHCNTWNGFAFKDARPMVVTEHLVIHDPILKSYKSPAQKVYHKLIHRYENRSLEVADRVVCVSNHTKAMLEQIFGYSDAQVIYNGIDHEFFRPRYINREEYLTKLDIEGDKTVLLFVGNPTIRKGADLLPDIMKKLGDDYILIMTSGLRGDVKRYGKNIRYVGKVDLNQLVNLYNFCDMFLFPTRSEGLALTVLEAMACGKPIITTDCASMPEVIREGHNGFLCEMNNVDDYAEKIHYLAQDKHLQVDMGARNQRKIQSIYNLQSMTEKYIKEYSSHI